MPNQQDIEYLVCMNAKPFVVILLTLILAAFFLSCGACSKKLDCPGYKDDTLDSWFPYKNNQQLIFVSNTNSSDTTTLGNTETTAPYQVTGGSLSRLYYEARKIFRSHELDSLKQNKIVVELVATGTRVVNFTIGRNAFYIYNLQSNGLGQINTNGRYLMPEQKAAVTINNRTFYNVIEAIGDTTASKTPGIYKLYYRRGEGLVGYSLYPSLITWVKQ